MTFQIALPETSGYDTLPLVKADALRQQAARIRELVKTTTASIIEIGHNLLAVKQALDHGQFTRWVEAECGFTPRTAENYIKVARFADGKSETVSLLHPGTAYKLASKAAPPKVVTEVLARVQSGEIVSDCEVKALLDEAVSDKRQAERQERKIRSRSSSKRKLRQREVEAEAHQERLRREEEDKKATARTIIERLGVDNVVFLLDVMTNNSWWAMEQHLRSGLDMLPLAETAR